MRPNVLRTTLKWIALLWGPPLLALATGNLWFLLGWVALVGFFALEMLAEG